jgi:hypothetical protein
MPAGGEKKEVILKSKYHDDFEIQRRCDVKSIVGATVKGTRSILNSVNVILGPEPQHKGRELRY